MAARGRFVAVAPARGAARAHRRAHHGGPAMTSEDTRMAFEAASAAATVAASETGSEASFPDDLGPAAYHGVIGELVRMIEPHNEAAPAAVLAQLVAAVGCYTGRRAGWLVESTFHAPAVWPVI